MNWNRLTRYLYCSIKMSPFSYMYHELKYIDQISVLQYQNVSLLLYVPWIEIDWPDICTALWKCQQVMWGNMRQHDFLCPNSPSLFIFNPTEPFCLIYIIWLFMQMLLTFKIYILETYDFPSMWMGLIWHLNGYISKRNADF